jgi:hypothetical protein
MVLALRGHGIECSVLHRQRLHSTLGYKTPAAYERYFDMRESQAAQSNRPLKRRSDQTG